MTSLVAYGEPAIGRGVPSEVAIHVLLYQPKTLHVGVGAARTAQQSNSATAQQRATPRAELGGGVALDPNCGIELERA